MHTIINFKTKKALKEAVRDGDVEVEPNFIRPENSAGSQCIEMPHEFHKSYASVTVVQEGDLFLIKQGSRVT